MLGIGVVLRRKILFFFDSELGFFVSKLWAIDVFGPVDMTPQMIQETLNYEKKIWVTPNSATD